MSNKLSVLYLFSILSLYVIFSSILLSSCTQKGNVAESNNELVNSCTSFSQNDSLLLLIADVTCSPPTQAIMCTDSIVRHGFVEVVYPYEQLRNQDIIWERELEVEGSTFLTVERRLNCKERGIFNSIIATLETINSPYVYDVRDDYQYILYLNNKKILSVAETSLGFDDFPPELSKIINNVLSMGTPLYPNFGFLIHGNN